MHFKYLTLSILLSICHFTISAQNFEKGYIIKEPGDTIFGYLQVNSDIKNISHCYYKNTSDGKIKTFKPNEIFGYRFLDGKYYISKTIVIDSTNHEMFVEYLVDGISDLYYYRENDKERFLIEKDNDLYLINGVEERTVYDKENGYERTFSSKSKSIGILKIAYKDAPSIYSKIETNSFDQKSMIKLVKSYHDEVCNEYECIIFNKNTKVKYYGVGVFGGIGLSKAKFKNYSSEKYWDFLTETKPSTLTNPIFGLYFVNSLPMINERMLNEVVLIHSNVSHIIDYSGDRYSSISNLDYNQTAFGINFGYILIQKTKLWIVPGIGLNYVYVNNIKTKVEITEGIVTFRDEDFMNLSINSSFSLTLGIDTYYRVGKNYQFKMSIKQDLRTDLPKHDILSARYNNFYLTCGVVRQLNFN